jgi:hypothetical protein
VITFATLFLGLVFGVVNVELDIARGVQSVKLLLDGKEVAALDAPWRTQVDLGPALSPHELVAVAFDGTGREVGRERQWINRPRAIAEAGFVLEPGAGGTGRIARLSWMSVGHETPTSITVTFDGRKLVVSDPRKIELPAHVPEQVHFLRAVVDFGGGVSAVADVTFGGTRKAEVLSEMTAVPVELEKGKELPPTEAMAGWFTHRGEPLTVAAVDEGSARVVFVLAGGALAELQRMEAGRGRSGLRGVELGRWDGALGRKQRFLFLWTDPEQEVRSKDTLSFYTLTPERTWRDGGVLGVAAHLSRARPIRPERVAQAVAVAGLAAAGREQRRAVVLLVGRDPSDESSLPAEEAARFLQRLHVPFHVWSVAEVASPVASRFGVVVDASTRSRFESATSSLSKLLDRQRVVWVVGSFLPHEVELTARASSLKPVFTPTVPVRAWSASGRSERVRAGEAGHAQRGHDGRDVVGHEGGRAEAGEADRLHGVVHCRDVDADLFGLRLGEEALSGEGDGGGDAAAAVGQVRPEASLGAVDRAVVAEGGFDGGLRLADPPERLRGGARDDAPVEGVELRQERGDPELEEAGSRRGAWLELHEEAAVVAVARQDVAEQRHSAVPTAVRESDREEIGKVEGRDGKTSVPENDLRFGGDGDLAVGGEADVKVEGVGSVRLGLVEGFDRVLHGVAGRAAAGDDEGRIASEDVHPARDYPRAR